MRRRRSKLFSCTNTQVLDFYYYYYYYYYTIIKHIIFIYSHGDLSNKFTKFCSGATEFLLRHFTNHKIISLFCEYLPNLMCTKYNMK